MIDRQTDRQTDRHMTTAYTALAWRRAVKTMSLHGVSQRYFSFFLFSYNAKLTNIFLFYSTAQHYVINCRRSPASERLLPLDPLQGICPKTPLGPSVPETHWRTLHDVWPSPRLVHHIYIFGGSCPITEFCQVPNSLRVQVLRSYIGSVTARHSSSGRQTNFAALSTGCHLYSAVRPSRWALAHILVVVYFAEDRRLLGGHCPQILYLPSRRLTDGPNLPKSRIRPCNESRNITRGSTGAQCDVRFHFTIQYVMYFQFRGMFIHNTT